MLPRLTSNWDDLECLLLLPALLGVGVIGMECLVVKATLGMDSRASCWPVRAADSTESLRSPIFVSL